MGVKSSARPRGAARNVSNKPVANSNVRPQSEPIKSHTMDSPDLDGLRDARSSYYSRSTHERIKELKSGRYTKNEQGDRRSVRSSGLSTTSSTRQRRPRARRDQANNSDHASVYPDRSPHVSRRREDAIPEEPLRPRKMRSRDDSDRQRSAKHEDRSSRRPVPQRSHTTPVPTVKAPRVTVVPVDSRQSSASSASSNTNRRTSGIFGTFFRTKSANAVPSVRLVECLTCGSDDIPSSKSAKLGCGHRM